MSLLTKGKIDLWRELTENRVRKPWFAASQLGHVKHRPGGRHVIRGEQRSPVFAEEGKHNG